MIYDYFLELDNETTAVAASQATADVMDLALVAPNKGTRTVNTFLVFTITTTGTGGSGTYDFALQGSVDEGFSSPIVYGSSGAITCTSVTRGLQYEFKIPAEHARFLRGYVTVGGTGAGAMTYDAHIAHMV